MAPDVCKLRHLTLAVENGHLGIVEKLLTVGKVREGLRRVYQGGKGNAHRHPLWRAAAQGYGEIVKLLISVEGIVYGIADGREWSPLHVAADGGYTEIVRLLSEGGADVNAVTADGQTL